MAVVLIQIKLKSLILEINPIEEIDKKILNRVESLLKNKSPRLITVSRLDKRKNHEKIIMALRNLKQIYPNIIYICVGYGEEENNIKSLVKELNLEEQFFVFKRYFTRYEKCINFKIKFIRNAFNNLQKIC